jgi:sulfide:quinone oxidoreductase
MQRSIEGADIDAAALAEATMPKIIVLGGGIGGISMAYELRSAVGRAAEITVVSDTPWFHFVPSNPWVALGWRRPEDIKVPLAEVLPKFGIAFDPAGARRLSRPTAQSS